MTSHTKISTEQASKMGEELARKLSLAKLKIVSKE